MLISTVLLFGIFLYAFYKFSFHRPENFPPGPPRLPIWGSYWFLLLLNYNFPALAIAKLSKFYKSSILGFYMGAFPTVVVHKQSQIKELLTRQEFDGRMDVIVGRLRGEGKRLGIFFTDGPHWHEQRRFALRYMRDWGFGRRCARLEQLIADEINSMLGFIRNPPKDQDIVNGNEISIPDIFYVPLINSVLGVFQGRAMDPSKFARLATFGRNALKFLRHGDDMGGALSLTPWIRHIMPQFSGYAPMLESNKNLVELIKDVIKDCKENEAEEYDSNFFDKYLKTIKEVQSEDGDTRFTEDQLALIGVDFLFPSSSTTAVSLGFFLREMMRRPDIQSRIHKEIDEVVGNGKLPDLDDRIKMPYTEACLKETLRFEPLIPLGIPHRAQIDTTFDGYFIPKDTMMVVNLWSYHMDPDVWGDPEVFRPERFLDDNGQILKNDLILTFGAGKRLCAGETFAKQTMFLIASALLQNFSIESAKPNFVPKLVPGIIVSAEKFWVRLTPRN